MCDWDFWSEYKKFRGDINKSPKTVYVKYDFINVFYEKYFKQVVLDKFMYNKYSW